MKLAHRTAVPAAPADARIPLRGQFQRAPLGSDVGTGPMLIRLLARPEALKGFPD
jgi:hypothetical protein